MYQRKLNQMNYLKNKKVYLAGPMEANCDQSWRSDMKDQLEKLFGMVVFDPNADTKQQWVNDLLMARAIIDFDTIEEIAEGFVQKDLGVIDRQDLLIANLPYKVPTVGTVHEIINAYSNLKKPVILFCEQGKEFIPFWYYGFIDHRYFMFGSREEVYKQLARIDQGLIEHRRFNFIYGKI